jgi:hypothetical protein
VSCSLTSIDRGDHTALTEHHSTVTTRYHFEIRKFSLLWGICDFFRMLRCREDMLYFQYRWNEFIARKRDSLFQGRVADDSTPL